MLNNKIIPILIVLSLVSFVRNCESEFAIKRLKKSVGNVQGVINSNTELIEYLILKDELDNGN